MGTAVPCDLGHVSQQSTQSACVLHSEMPGPLGRLRVAHHILPRVLSNPGALHSMDVLFPSQCTINQIDSDLHTLPAKHLSQEREKLAGNISVLQQGNLQQQTQGHKGDIATSTLPGAQATKLTSSEATCQKSRTSRPHSPAGDKNIRACLVALAHDPHAWEAESGLLCV